MMMKVEQGLVLLVMTNEIRRVSGINTKSIFLIDFEVQLFICLCKKRRVKNVFQNCLFVVQTPPDQVPNIVTNVTQVCG